LIAGDKSPAYRVPGAAPNFDRLAGVYRWMEALSFGGWLWRCRCAFLGEMCSARRALVVGDGDGRFTARLLEKNRAVLVDAVDISPAMLEALVRRAGKDSMPQGLKPLADLRLVAGDKSPAYHESPVCDESPACRYRVRALVADVREELPAGDGCDLVVTHFLLDCLTTAEVESLARRVRARVADDAVWVVSEFAIPEGWFGRLVAGPVVGFLYWAFRWMTGLRVRELPDWAGALERAGFVRRRSQAWLRGLLLSEVWACGDEGRGGGRGFPP
jgi:SAM-dependent methyltransferase